MKKYFLSFNFVLLLPILFVSCASTEQGVPANAAVNSMISDASGSDMAMLTKSLERLSLAIDQKLNKSAGRLSENVKTSWEQARIEVLRTSTRVEQWASTPVDALTTELVIHVKKTIDQLSKALETFPSPQTP